MIEAEAQFESLTPFATARARFSLSQPPAPELTIVLATLNEHVSLPVLVDRLLHAPLPPLEIVVVDDGSRDGTREYLSSIAQEDRRVRPIFHEGAQTLLKAHAQGIAAARGDLVVVMDADLQHNPADVPRIVDLLLHGNDLVVASRYAPGGSPGERSALRSCISLGAETLARVLLPEARSVSDPLSGFYGFRRGYYRAINPDYRGYELLPFVLGMMRGRPVTEVPYVFESRRAGKSKIVTRDLSFIRVFLTELVLAARVARTGGNESPGSQAPSSAVPPGIRGRVEP